jgi:hypothetical protein
MYYDKYMTKWQTNYADNSCSKFRNQAIWDTLYEKGFKLGQEEWILLELGWGGGTEGELSNRSVLSMCEALSAIPRANQNQLNKKRLEYRNGDCEDTQ